MLLPLLLGTLNLNPSAADAVTTARQAQGAHRPAVKLSGETKKLNVLMIGVDDLRPDISGPSFEQTEVRTPNLERLAKQGTAFQRAYCQVALCSPSRTVLLTGLRPDSTKIWSIGPYFRHTMDSLGGRGGGQDVITLPQMFKKAGYYTTGAGKIFHVRFRSIYCRRQPLLFD